MDGHVQQPENVLGAEPLKLVSPVGQARVRPPASAPTWSASACASASVHVTSGSGFGEQA
jgi:hypothetical protein